jgi:hypothetical protein
VAFQPLATALVGHFKVAVSEKAHRRKDRSAKIGAPLPAYHSHNIPMDNVDWDTQDGHYRVRLYGEWIVVP